ncbi:hypothetical protein BDZ45DRAFT_673155 [Acephala macrosclerotiorum]|nr:hypothetical protein BDZ45DRAFT_673155 [Acephala macrosclerotiorum]
MAPQPSQMFNMITWTEIPVIDIPRAKAFYSAIFGWTYPNFGPPTDSTSSPGAISLFKKGTMNGSFVLVSAENAPDPEKSIFGVKITITVESVDEKLVEIEKAGEKKELPKNRGVTAYFVDTEGNVVGLWSKK